MSLKEGVEERKIYNGQQYKRKTQKGRKNKEE